MTSVAERGRVDPALERVELGCVVAKETGLLVVLTERGAVCATYGSGMLAAIAGDRTRAGEVGEWVGLRRWPDGPVTVESWLGVRVGAERGAGVVTCFPRGKRDPSDPGVPGRWRALPGGRLPRRLGRRS